MILEVCVDSPRGLHNAVEAGADRIELCSALALGGLSPNPGLVALASKAAVPVYAMVRPRPGDFIFDAADEAAMLAEIDQLRAHGIAGVVLGANRPDGTLDADLLARLIARAQGMGTTLHRAFDLTPDQPAALETAIELGFDRVLTSGGQRSVLDAVPTIAQLLAQASGRITVMPGGGIKPANGEQMLAVPGINEIHASCRSPLGLDPQSLPVQFGFQPADEGETDPALVARMRAILSQHSA
jgi:copper homeostasis protein